ncbi:hypothetical protein ACG33_14800 [Steroidobacter denitrificans]|uniref:Phytochrome sensor protein n=1 Tax=Steroidobacter denitrificans TaxID=465721 RepID=A0A127FEL0_STEDE|nr:DUF484 family protein [Steroidobacter denitrificans]AMN48341.1 hypothetical protein ACG33_14800 [Steroidobacter denitrificans]
MSKQPVRGVGMESRIDTAESQAGSVVSASASVRHKAPEPSEAEVADFLQRHPDFFERHGALLTKMVLSHARGSTTISLIERQVLALREKNEALETKLRELIDIARGNDVLATRIHRLACRLLRTGTAAELMDALEVSLREDFGASEWLLLLAADTRPDFTGIHDRHLRLVASGAPELKMFETLFASARPRCGQIRDSQRDFLFGAGTIEIGSAALVPLGPQPSSGLLAIGSPDAERFHPAMSTEFLARIGDLVSEAVCSV